MPEFTDRVYNITLEDKRSSWPRPEVIIDELVSGRGVREIMERLGISYHVIRAYRKEDPNFDADYTAAINSEENMSRQKKIRLSNIKNPELTPKERFLEHFGKTYKLEEARRHSGLDATEIESYLDPNSDVYDVEFVGQFNEMCKRRKWKLDDEMFEKRANDKILTTLVEAEMPEKYKSKPVQIDSLISVDFSEGSQRNAIKLLNNLFGDADGSNGSQPIIDITASGQPKGLLGSSEEDSES